MHCSGRQIKREIKGGQLGERVGKKVGEKVVKKTGEKVGESLGEIDKLNLYRIRQRIQTVVIRARSEEGAK